MDSSLRGATLISLARPKGKGEKTAHLSVRFLSAVEFVSQYADNLRRGGLFVRNAEELLPLEEVTVDLHLPGFKWFRLNARVTHVVDEIMSESMNAPIGAGLELVSPPENFMKALHAYLERIGQRGDRVVLVAECDCKPMLEAAGYWCKEVDATSIAPALESHASELRAVVIPAKLVTTYQGLLRGTAGEELLAIFNRSNPDSILVDLDARLPG